MVDDHHLFRRGLAILLAERGILVVGEAGYVEAVALIARLTPDVVLMGLNKPAASALETTRRIARVSPASRVLVLSVSATAPDVAQTLLAGACGHLRKDASIDEIVRRVRAAALPRRTSVSAARSMNGSSEPDGRLEVTASERTRERRRPARVELTTRELEILRLVAAGRSNPDIAAELVISAMTVKNHVSHILAKLQISNRTAAAAYAARAGLIHR